MDESKIRKIIKEEIEKYMERAQYSNTKIPKHEHDGSDTVKIATGNIKEAIAIDGTPGGVFNLDVLNTQKVDLDYTSDIKNPPVISTLPVHIIYGFGVGVHSAFEGGNATPGTMVLFENGATLSALYIMTENGWRGINCDS